MKIKRRDLVHLIREMAMDEMAYMGMPDIQRGKQYAAGLDKVAPVVVDPSIKSDKKIKINKNLDAIEKFFKSSMFAKKAEKFFGEDRGFPGSNVWVIPQIGDKNTDSFHFDKNQPYYQKPFYRDTIFQVSRTRGFDAAINKEYLLLLGMTEKDISSVDFSNDIIFVPRVSSLTKRALPTPHMIIHALFDGGVMSNANEEAVDRVFHRLDGVEDDIRSTATAALRRPIGLGDIVPEILTGALLYKDGAKKTKVVDDEFEDYLYDAEGMGLTAMLEAAAEATRDYLKGKIVVVDVT